MSSRNRRLSDAERPRAVCINAGLDAAAAAFERGERDVDVLTATACAPVDAEPLARREYLSIVEPHTLAPLSRSIAEPALIVTATWFGEVRLIDNRLLGAADR